MDVSGRQSTGNYFDAISQFHMYSVAFLAGVFGIKKR